MLACLPVVFGSGWFGANVFVGVVAVELCWIACCLACVVCLFGRLVVGFWGLWLYLLDFAWCLVF